MYGLGSEERPRSRKSTRVLRTFALLGVIGWFVFIAVLIHGEPAPGAASPDELARDYESALNDHDADRVALLLGAPISGDADAVAKFLVGREHVGRWHVSVVANGLAVSDDGQARAVLAVAEHDGRWQVNPIESSVD
jgi:hypothetical protein